MPGGGKYERKFGRGANARFGAGLPVRQLPQKQTLRLDNFELGMVTIDDPEGTSKQGIPLAVDLEVNERGRIIRAPGTTMLGTFGTVYEPKQFYAHRTTYGFTNLIFLDRDGNIGVRLSGYPTNWSNLASLFNARWSGAAYADTFVISNGSSVWSVNAAGTITAETDIPPFWDATIAEGRLYVVKGSIVQWSGVSGLYPFRDFSSITSGGEQLISEASANRIVAIRAFGLGFTAILTVDGIWVGRATGDPTRPLSFEPRVAAGCVSKDSVQAVEAGLIYLSQDGVYLYDGNSSRMISQVINADLLPIKLDPDADDGVRQYQSSYNSEKKRYYLHTNRGTYVYDIQRQRWFKRSLVCYGGQMVSGFFDFYTDPSPIVASQVDLIFLGIAGIDTNVEKEDYDSLANFGTEFTPFYEGPTSLDPSSKYLKMVSAAKITYSGYGTVQLYLQNQERLYEEAGPPIPLTLSTELREEQITFIHTGELLGLKFEILNGKLEIAAIELDWIPRGPNFSGQIRKCHFEQAPDGSFFITDVPGPAYGWFLDTSVTPNEIVFDSTLVGPEFAVVGYDTDGSPLIEV